MAFQKIFSRAGACAPASTNGFPYQGISKYVDIHCTKKTSYIGWYSLKKLVEYVLNMDMARNFIWSKTNIVVSGRENNVRRKKINSSIVTNQPFPEHKDFF